MGMKRWISTALTAVMLLTFLPANALAADGGTPELSSLTVKTADGRELSLLEGDTAVDLGGSYSFTAAFDNPEQIETVYITSTKGSAVRMLEAQWDGTAFTTNGWFGGNADYTPGKIGVQYTVKTEENSMTGTVDWAALETEGCTAQVTASSGQLTEATVDLTALLEAEGKVTVDLAVDVFDETTGGNLNDWLGTYKDLELLTKYTLDGGKYILYLDYSDPSTYAMIVHDVSGSKFVKTVLDEAAGSSKTLRALSEQLGTIKTVSGLAGQFFTIQDSAEQLREQVSGRTDLTGSEKEQLNQSIDNYENDRLLFTLTMTLLPAVVAASGGTMAGPALVFNALVGVINAASGFFWDNRVGMLTGCDPLNTDFTSDAHGTPLTKKLLSQMDYTLTESGTYYLAERISSDIRIDGAHVTICKHGYGCTLINDGGSLEVRDCMYEEDLDGNMIGWSLYASVTNNSGDVSVFCGQVTVDSPGDGNIYIYEGTVNKVAVEGDGDTIVYGGTVQRIENGCGDLTIHDGRVGQITNAEGTVQIDGGQVVRDGRGTVLKNESGTITISGGLVKGYDGPEATATGSTAIENGAGGTLIITEGVIMGGAGDEVSYPSIENSGTLTISGGTFSCGSQNGCGTCIDNSGTAEIFGGRFLGCIDNESREAGEGLTICGGTFQAAEDYNIANYWGSVVIEDGTFQVMGESDQYCNVNSRPGNAKAVADTIVRGGTFYCESGNCVESWTTTASLRTTIEGGSFYSPMGSCVYNLGNDVSMAISGGTFISEDPPVFQGCVTNGGNGVLEISGGTFTCLEGDPCVFSDDNPNVTISGGTFLVPEGLSVVEGKGCTLLVGENSDIEMIGRFGLFKSGSYTGEFQLTMDTPAGYDGGIVYYDAPEGAGVSVTPAELMAMDFSREKYLRLVGDMSLGGTSSEGVSVSLSGSGEELRTAKVSDPNQVLTSDTLVWAASYEGGKMTGITSGILKADGTVTFSEPVEAGAVLFFLDGENKPMCGNILLQLEKTT